ncbi:MAG: MATE family efflux transporter [Eubacteriales bacterium]|nr:MATE family efflux transporter [Eubacteriales bacterium]
MHIRLSDHFTYGRLLRFTFPTVIMMLFTSVYSIVDGLFVANFVSTNALASINIIYPLIMMVGAFGFMLGSGGSAEISRTLGEGNRKRAQEIFSLLIVVILVLGIVLSAFCLYYIRPLCRLFGSSDLLMEDCVAYGAILLIGTPAFMLQSAFQTFFVTAEKPHTGLALTVAAGMTNIVFDYVFICVIPLGIAGAAIATVLGYLVGGVIPVFYFLLPNTSRLRLVRPGWYWRTLLHSCANGSSEMFSNISMSIVTLLYNLRLMEMIGEDGVAAISVIMYVSFIFIAVLLGFSIGCAPIIGYHFGADNRAELQNMFRKSYAIILVASVGMTVLAEVFARPLVAVFISDKPELITLTTHAFRLYSISYLLSGINIFASAFFTALCNGAISAIISTLRTLILQAAMIFILPVFLGLNGIWLAVVAGEILTLAVSLYFLIRNRERYHYV